MYKKYVHEKLSFLEHDLKNNLAAQLLSLTLAQFASIESDLSVEFLSTWQFFTLTIQTQTKHSL